MTHEDAGKYSAKHPPGSRCRPETAAAVKKNAADNRISCAAAHQIARDEKISPAEVGKTIDLMEYRLIKCRMGLFGYSPQKKIVTPSEQIAEPLQQAVQAAEQEGKIPCAVCWQIAADLSIPKMTVSGACEALGIKVSPCQLGAF